MTDPFPALQETRKKIQNKVEFPTGRALSGKVRRRILRKIRDGVGVPDREKLKREFREAHK